MSASLACTPIGCPILALARSRLCRQAFFSGFSRVSESAEEHESDQYSHSNGAELVALTISRVLSERELMSCKGGEVAGLCGEVELGEVEQRKRIVCSHVESAGVALEPECESMEAE